MRHKINDLIDSGVLEPDEEKTQKLIEEWNEIGRELIDHPKHYTQGIECWDYIVSHEMNYLQGNIIKYVTRYKHKNGLEDLKKAQAYLNKLIENYG